MFNIQNYRGKEGNLCILMQRSESLSLLELGSVSDITNVRWKNSVLLGGLKGSFILPKNNTDQTFCFIKFRY